MKRVVGLTGGIACGKSAAAKAFAALGVDIIDADALAREIVQPGEPALAAIAERFGPEMLTPDGQLNRPALARLVFTDAQAREDLNAITHPRIAAQGAARIRALEDTPSPYILYEAALLVENGSYRAFGGLVVVTVEPATQLARLMARDGATEAEALARISSQLPLAQKVAAADWVLHNDGDVEVLRAQVADVHAQILASLGQNEASEVGS